MSFLDVLTTKKMLPGSSAAEIEQEAGRRNVSVESVLAEHGVTAEQVLGAKGEYFKIPTRSLASHEVASDILRYIPEESVRHYEFAPLGITEGVLEVGIVDPDNIGARDALQFISTKINTPYKLFLISRQDFEKVLENYKSLSGEVTKALSELETELTPREVGEEETVEAKLQDGTEAKIIEDAPVTKIVATILKYAIEANASDIHIEPTDEEVRVRFRVDGALQTNLLLPKKVHQAVVARIKILSNMKLDERRKPQDNRFRTRAEGRPIDLRVSTFPTNYGEKVVMRILDTEHGVFTLDSLGLSKRNLRLIREAIKQPYGLIIISGPTGSGKTTTLYAMVNELDKETKNVLSLEDPVEYSIPGMNQSQVRPEIGYTFASGLRTTLRQDPDIIMVGEIRDKETAGLAVQAALTGHLVLSTLHTNNAVGVIPRLLDMEVDPYLLPPTLILAMAQRLVRTLCPGSGKPIRVEGSMKTMIEHQFSDLPPEHRRDITLGDTVYEIAPTKDCPKGTKGRMAVFEALEMDRAIEQIILKSGSETELLGAARKQGMLTMKEDAILKAFDRLIPFEEVNTLGTVLDADFEAEAEVESKSLAEPKIESGSE
ncbi:GspE/PulE family protein [Candidatus Wolfebacteria bacterium]|nr:GspE/PulE family protein [Candidatus Wolfebacteria bacterium]